MQDFTVFSDYICPFCFIGKRRAERLGAELSMRPVWQGFEIHPETPPEGVPLSSFMPGIISNLEGRIRDLAEEIGLEMRMPEKLSNSRLALLGGEFAREEGKLEAYHEAVFAAYFQQGKDIGDMEILLDIASGIGLDRDSFRSSLESDRHFPALRESRRQATSLGLSAVPSYLFEDGSVVVGAQPYELLKSAAEKSLDNAAHN
jgi:predicted DsbA family dithiol-disulfide isomerase